MNGRLSTFGLVAALALATVSDQANALTIRVSDSSNPVVDFVEIVDGGAGDLDGVINGSILTGALSVGSGSLSISTAFILDALNTSTLRLTVTNAVATASDLWVDVWHAAFSGAAATPLTSAAEFSMNSTSLSDGGELLGRARVGATFTGPKGSITSTGDTILQSVSTALDDPFTMRINTDVVAGTTRADYQATLVATGVVPLPAGGVLLLTALGGLGLARRRRKAA